MNYKNRLLFTILLPVHRSTNLLQYSIESVLSQTINSFELFIICDGVKPDVVECAHSFAKKDQRIHVFEFPKGQRFGEAHRHTALMQANGQFIAGIGDDDLWFPNHLEEMQKLLLAVDFGNLYQTEIDSEGHFFGHIGDLGDDQYIDKMLHTKFNFFGPTVCGYKLSAYHQLKKGWSPAPEDIWSDLYMWRKFISTEGLKFGSRFAVTSLHFATSLRKTWSDEDREHEIKKWSLKIKSPAECHAISQHVLKMNLLLTNS